jgi:hypothetical protein
VNISKPCTVHICTKEIQGRCMTSKKLSKQQTFWWVVHGASCLWGELSMGELSMRKAAHGWGVFHGASSPWGEMSIGELSMGWAIRVARFHGVSCHCFMERVVMEWVAMGWAVQNYSVGLLQFNWLELFTSHWLMDWNESLATLQSRKAASPNQTY